VLTQPEDIELVLTNPKLQKKSKEYLVLQESIMGQGIFSIDDIKKWKNNRLVNILLKYACKKKSSKNLIQYVDLRL